MFPANVQGLTLREVLLRLPTLFCLLLVLVAFAPRTVAQQTSKVPTVGVVTSVTGGPLLEAFKRGMREYGYVEGRNVAFYYRSVGGNPDGFASHIAELLDLKIDVLVVPNNLGAFAAKRATSTIPIVVISAHDAVGTGLVASMPRPGGNVTGTESLAAELDAKRVELLKDIAPNLSRLAVIYNPADPAMQSHVRYAEAAAARLGIKVQRLEVRRPADFDGAFKAALAERADALMPFTETLVFSEIKRVIDFAAEYRVPVMYEFSAFVERGGLIAYGPSLPDLFRRAAFYVDKIIKGAKPADLPIGQPEKFELAVNARTARAMILAIPPSVRFRADTIIE
ncbi:MAG: transporter substrate binding protein [Microvirga sp.]|nr:transporter substrate binding protein [Microvirga sp.]